MESNIRPRRTHLAYSSQGTQTRRESCQRGKVQQARKLDGCSYSPPHWPSTKHTPPQPILKAGPSAERYTIHTFILLPILAGIIISK